MIGIAPPDSGVPGSPPSELHRAPPAGSKGGISMRAYEVTLVEHNAPPHREGLTLVARVLRRCRRDALRGWTDRYSVVGIRTLPRTESVQPVSEADVGD